MIGSFSVGTCSTVKNQYGGRNMFYIFYHVIQIIAPKLTYSLVNFVNFPINGCIEIPLKMIFLFRIVVLNTVNLSVWAVRNIYCR